MQRDCQALADRVFDVLVIGGGIFGACAAWDATLRGLSVALVERTDFGAGTSANSYKFVHGGIRYLQHLDLKRIRRSCAERSALLSIAPHLVAPVPIAIPTYRGGRRGKAYLGAGMLLYDALTADRNLRIRDRNRRIPLTRFLGPRDVVGLFPGIGDEGLSGAAVFYDGQMYNPTRLVLAFVRSAVENGAVAVNYAQAEQLLRADETVIGARVRDEVTGDAIEVRARAVLNAAGPWVPWMMADAENEPLKNRGTYSRDACFVVKRRFRHDYALALQGRTRDPDAILSRAARHLFLTPWRDYTLCGVWHRIWTEHPDRVRIGERELAGYIDEINEALPALGLQPRDVTMWNAGLLPFGDNEVGAEHLRYGKRSHVIDHREEHGLDNLVSLIGVRYTMARADAGTAVDLVAKKLGERVERPPTHRVPLHGGDFESFDGLVNTVARAAPQNLAPGAVAALAHNYGSDFRSVLRLADGAWSGCLAGATTLRAEILHAIRHEMALTLADVVFRRTDLATGGHPGPEALYEAAALAADALGWDERRRRAEIAAVEKRFVVGNSVERPSTISLLQGAPPDVAAGASA
ncbi:MAG TPA: glycerol-3-phosphate dehydrogenase/oxidase [Gammaproteobacteria bacterium]|nr:glycerol-3-phosphate dehydrogenase/oxidase [Gammaproteobacteria bacterium]